MLSWHNNMLSYHKDYHFLPAPHSPLDIDFFSIWRHLAYQILVWIGVGGVLLLPGCNSMGSWHPRQYVGIFTVAKGQPWHGLSLTQRLHAFRFLFLFILLTFSSWFLTSMGNGCALAYDGLSNCTYIIFSFGGNI